LLTLLGIQNKTVSNHKFNEKRQVEFLLSQLENGKDVALVSDAGTPCVSDPGGMIVRAAAELGVAVVGVPGASAVLTALSVCGFGLDAFAFYGFLPRAAGELMKTIDTARRGGVSAAVFFESPKRVKKTLAAFADALPDAQLCLCNDLTKRFERVYRGTPPQVLDELNANPSAEKGEYTLVVRLTGLELAAESAGSLSPEAMIADHMVRHGGSVKEAVNALAAEHSGRIGKKEFYAASLNLRGLFGA
jgi:16S rRNA (cytidine1402-2'-O)-methyltransferase